MERDYKQKHAQKQEQVQLLLKELEQCYNDNSALKLSKKQTTKGTHIYMIVYKSKPKPLQPNPSLQSTKRQRARGVNSQAHWGTSRTGVVIK